MGVHAHNEDPQYDGTVLFILFGRSFSAGIQFGVW